MKRVVLAGQTPEGMTAAAACFPPAEGCGRAGDGGGAAPPVRHRAVGGRLGGAAARTQAGARRSGCAWGKGRAGSGERFSETVKRAVLVGQTPEDMTAAAARPPARDCGRAGDGRGAAPPVQHRAVGGRPGERLSLGPAA
ncbi:hypothetical protein J2T17_000932 [Paenibacillus mucilaginosus]|uniref:hypothetical protein n=1 Tax=Paenibacillus mucilaginosus TaxID=61624 RepID=UPI003D1DCDBD